MATTSTASIHSRILGCTPWAQLSGTVALDHVDLGAAVEIDQARGVDGVVGPCRREERGLVDAEGQDVADPAGIVDEGRAVTHYSVHHGPPTHPELVGHDGHGQGELAELAGGLGTGAHREERPGRDVRRALGPALGLTVEIGAAPAPLEPDQPGRTPEAGQVPHATPLTADLVSRRLDRDA